MARPKKRSKVYERNRVTARSKARKATKSTRGKASKRAMQQKQAISATVTGNDQQVGFRAMVMKQAIKYNLAGSAKNERNEIVQFTLQGDANRLGLAVATIRERNEEIIQCRCHYNSSRSRPRFKHVYSH